MRTLIPAGRALVIGAVVVGALALGAPGVAGAAASPAPTATPAAAHFNCANATRALTRIDKVEARVSAGLPKLHAAEARAAKAGRTRLANRIEKRIRRLESAEAGKRLSRRSAAIEAKCHVAAPSGS